MENQLDINEKIIQILIETKFRPEDFSGIIYTEARAKCLEEGFSEEPGSLIGRVYQNMADTANRKLNKAVLRLVALRDF